MFFQKKIMVTAGAMVFLFASLLSLKAEPAKAVSGCSGFNPSDPYGLECGAETGLSSRDPRIIVAQIINVGLSVLGIVFIVLIVYAGFKWMTAGGNEEDAKKAQKILLYSIIGLGIILSAFAISQFVLSELYKATQGTRSYP